jgi:hypothetical protein
VTGFIARSRDTADIAAKTAALLREGDLRAAMARAARDSALGREWRVINRRLLEDYDQVIAARAVHRAEVA